MKLTIKEEYEIDQIEQELQNLITHVYKQKRNKKLYIGLVQTLTCLPPWSQKAPSALAKGMNDDHIKEIKIK